MTSNVKAIVNAIYSEYHGQPIDVWIGGPGRFAEIMTVHIEQTLAEWEDLIRRLDLASAQLADARCQVVEECAQLVGGKLWNRYRDGFYSAAQQATCTEAATAIRALLLPPTGPGGGA